MPGAIFSFGSMFALPDSHGAKSSSFATFFIWMCVYTGYVHALLSNNPHSTHVPLLFRTELLEREGML